MCYVIENFCSYFPKLKLNLKYKLFLFNQILFKYTYFLKKFSWFTFSVSFNVNPTSLILKVMKAFFREGFYLFPKKLLAITNQPITINLTKTLKYWVLKLFFKLIDTNKDNRINNRCFSYHYYLNQKVLNLSVSKDQYNEVVVFLLKLNLFTWFQLNHNLRNLVNYITITDIYLVLRYYNSYFFKIYTM